MRTTILLAAVLSACSGSNGVDTNLVTESEQASHEAFAPAVLEIAMNYNRNGQGLSQPEGSVETWTKLGDVPRWAPELCRAPPQPGPLVSESSDEGSHGRKLYYLHTKDVVAYRGAASQDQPIGQAFVKESYEAHQVEESDTEFSNARWKGKAITRKGKRWGLGQARDLFVMYKLDPSTPGTDEGWVYGTVTADLEVTSAGRVASCMECHVDARRDRMFGAKAEDEVASSGWDAWDLPDPSEEE